MSGEAGSAHLPRPDSREILENLSEIALRERLRSGFDNLKMLPGTTALMKLESIKKICAARDSLLSVITSPAYLKEASRNPTELRRTLELLWNIEKTYTDELFRYSAPLPCTSEQGNGSSQFQFEEEDEARQEKNEAENYTTP